MPRISRKSAHAKSMLLWLRRGGKSTSESHSDSRSRRSLIERLETRRLLFGSTYNFIPNPGAEDYTFPSQWEVYDGDFVMTLKWNHTGIAQLRR